MHRANQQQAFLPWRPIALLLIVALAGCVNDSWSMRLVSPSESGTFWVPTQAMSVSVDADDVQLISPDGRAWQGAVTIAATPGEWNYTSPSGFSATLAGNRPPEGFLHAIRVLSPDAFFEANVLPDEGTRFHWSWESDGRVSFNVHVHEPSLRNVVQGAGATGMGSLRADAATGHSLMWRNAGDQGVEMRLWLWGAQIDGVHAT